MAFLICYSCCPYPTTFDAIIPDEVSWFVDRRPESVDCAYHHWEALCGVCFNCNLDGIGGAPLLLVVMSILCDFYE